MTLFTCLGPPIWAAESEINTPDAVVYGVEMYSGCQIDTHGQGYGYIGAGLDRNVSDHWALTAKIFGSHLIYEYESNADEIKARAPGVRLHAGAKHFDIGEYFIITGGLDYRDTSLSPDDKESDLRGAKTGASLECIYSKYVSERVVLDLIGIYSTIGNFTWGRARLKRLIPSISVNTGRQIFVGVEGTGEGNSDYSGYSIGSLIEIQKIKQRFSLLLAGGYKHTDSISDSCYLGLELYCKF